MRYDTIKLVTKTYTADAIGQKVATETLSEVFCSLHSVTRDEFFKAGAVGIVPTYRVTTPVVNYGGQDEVEYGSKRYKVYRTYQTGDDVELYLRELV